MENETGYLLLTTADGKDLPVRYGLSAIRRLCKLFNCKLADLPAKVNEAAKEDQIELMLQLIKVGAESDAALENRVFAFNDEQLLSAFDKPGVFNKLMEAFNGSFGAFSEIPATESAPGNKKAAESKK